jgi:small subunit ribosomal protein S15
MIAKLAKDGYSPSQMGVKLRDEYGIPLVKPILGRGLVQVLTENKVQPPMPEELDRLLRRAKRLQDHLNRNKGDRKNVRSLELLEAKIHRLAKYYKEKKVIPEGWKYQTVVAQLA